MDRSPQQRVEDGRRNGRQRLAFAGGELDEAAAREGDASGHLHVVGPESDRPVRDLPRQREGFRQQVVERSAMGALPQADRGVTQAGVGERAGRRRVHLLDRRQVGSDVVFDRRPCHVPVAFVDLVGDRPLGSCGHVQSLRASDRCRSSRDEKMLGI